jgi:hypothetical protein
LDRSHCKHQRFIGGLKTYYSVTASPVTQAPLEKATDLITEQDRHMDDEITILEMPNKMTFAWWNTSLSPRAKSRSKVEVQQFALSVIEHMISYQGADFIALGEVSELDMTYFTQNNSFLNFKYVSAVIDSGTTKVDLGYVYNTGFISIIDDIPIITPIAKKKHKVAQRVRLEILGYDSILSVFISHWPSRMYVDSNHPKRHAISLSLRLKVDQALDLDERELVILLGDYNDEPYNVSLSEHLRASRDRSLVRKNATLLYNPFWSFLGDLLSEPTELGSYYYPKGETTRWFAFDQMIFSHGFILGKHWVLSDTSVYIARIPDLLERVLSAKHKFDHLPIFGTIEKV